MKLKSLLSIIALTFFLYSASGQILGNNNGFPSPAPKVKICHIPPGNPENAHEIEVSLHAAETHINNHGDYYGECTKDTVPPPPDTCYCDLDFDELNDLVYGYTETKNGVTAHFTPDGKTVYVTSNSNITSALLTLGDSSQVLLTGNGTKIDTFGIAANSFQIIAYIEVRTQSHTSGIILEFAPFTDPYDICECYGPPPWPVTMTSFKVEKVNDHTVLLRWTTASEENNDYFLIEKTYEFDSWEEVCKVKGAGTTQIPQEYECTDEEADEGGNNVVYYRPKQVDFNGMYEYFNLIKLRLQDIASSYSVEKVYPNPADDRIHIQYNSSENSLFDISILTLDGKVLVSNSYVAKTGDHVMDLNLEEDFLKAGLYILEVKAGEGIYRQKIYKQ